MNNGTPSPRSTISATSSEETPALPASRSTKREAGNDRELGLKYVGVKGLALAQAERELVGVP
jgi:hypothetical protein